MATQLSELPAQEGTPRTFAPGIYYDVPATEYHAAPGLSNSGMKDLAISPLRYWHLHINPNRESKESDAMDLGTAFHCAVLEPEKFASSYVRSIAAADYEGCLITMDDLREWAKGQGITFTARTKADMVKVIQTFCRNQGVAEPPILDILRQAHTAQHQGKTELSREEWDRVHGMAEALRSEKSIAPILKEGRAEVCVFARDPATGVLLKSRLDWISDATTVDLKSFSQKNGRSIDRSVTAAIAYESYYRQGYFYTLLRSLHGVKKQKSVMAFVESDTPHEVRIKEFTPVALGEANVYWGRAKLEVQSLIKTYAWYQKEFGTAPWRAAQTIEVLRDEELPNLAY